MLSEDEPGRHGFLLHAFHNVCHLADHQAEPEADATSAPCVALASVLSESMTTVGITPSPSWDVMPASCWLLVTSVTYG